MQLEADNPLKYVTTPDASSGTCSTTAAHRPRRETAINVSDTRGESTSLSESISLEISVGFLGLQKSSVEFKAFSNQSQGFSRSVEVSNAVQVSAGFKGWTEASGALGPASPAAPPSLRAST